MLVYVFLAPGFEEAEAITPYDMLLRAGLDVKTVAVSDGLGVRSAHGVLIHADTTIDALDSTVPDMVVLPGGMPGAKNLYENRTVCRFVTDAAKRGAFIGAICAAPLIPGRLGLLKGKKATCYPGFEDQLEGAVFAGGKVVRDGTVITAAGMGVALEFGAALIEALCGKEAADRVLAQIMA